MRLQPLSAKASAEATLLLASYEVVNEVFAPCAPRALPTCVIWHVLASHLHTPGCLRKRFAKTADAAKNLDRCFRAVSALDVLKGARAAAKRRLKGESISAQAPSRRVCAETRPGALRTTSSEARLVARQRGEF
jgi:hypothetical protein